ncbi:hypothetical protein KY290_011959 [Solanum tuberosum]|uniref:Endonuclease/exonuclease/phosphatase domain-containing protein n=1 Tax=Solanum tuberosum TaxID=4113 RepID=A0ABQ7W277_SOLTU|nr:hypothetical protein KY289_012479 [Solanum tuberosum]KAH0710619.1 hypothetical protein KY284_012046 [Solanum tuberosum]KAH0736803.1 hypothetical protein KY285_012510 [Solanum tuberosum]KAH0774822.1 hypothetical protein KY290_011959 [Solanum tuberosum]
MIIATWNVRGLNLPHKQKEVKLFLAKNKVEVFGCLETKVKAPKAQRIIHKLARDWQACHNYTETPNGRIWLMWQRHLTVNILEIRDQYIHCTIEDPRTQWTIYLTVLFAMTDNIHKDRMWGELMQVNRQYQHPWLLCGDFNSVLSSGNRIGLTITQAETLGFQGLIDAMQLTPLKSKGWYFTWCNKQSAGSRVYSKIDWALGDFQWVPQYGQVEAEFLHPSISDHSPILVKYCHQHNIHPKPFRFFPNVMEHPDFSSILQLVWTRMESDQPMKNVWCKLKKLKLQLKDINGSMATYQQKLSLAREKLGLMRDCAAELPCLDSMVVRDGVCLTVQQQKELIREVTYEEIADAIKTMPKEKAPGVDGFPIEFFTMNWADIISVRLLNEAFVKISKASGLQANVDKSSLYIAGVATHTKAEILEELGYVEGTLSFRYLGVPLASKKLSVNHYLPLIEKIIAKVTCWSAKLLSYAGRVQLIKSVLFGVQAYWSQIFFIPKKVMKSIEQICRTFLWTGNVTISKKALVSWENICKPTAALV